MSGPGLKSLNLPTAGDDLDEYMKERGVPVLGPSSATADAAPARPPRQKGAPTKKMSIEVPDYLPAQLRRLTLERDCTIRHIILDALHVAGYCDIAPEDRAKDGRRSQ